MRAYLIFTFLLLSSNLIWAQQKYIKLDLEAIEYDFKTERTLLKGAGIPLQGNFELIINPYQTEKSTFKDGFKNGQTRIYRKKRLAEIGMYKDNLKVGEWKYYDSNQKLWRLSNFENGLQEGEEKIYSNGKLIKIVNYKANHSVPESN